MNRSLRPAALVTTTLAAALAAAVLQAPAATAEVPVPTAAKPAGVDVPVITISKPAPVLDAADLVADAKPGVQRLEPFDARVRTMPERGTSHDFRAAAPSGSWSVVGSWSPTDGDVDLELFSDKGFTKSLGRSAFGPGVIDFVALDATVAGAGDYHPRVTTYSGESAYAVELAPSNGVLGNAPQELFMLPDDVVRIYDTQLKAGVTYTFTLDPLSPYLDGGMFLVGSTSGVKQSGAQRRIDAIRTSISQGAGGTETFTFTPSVTDRYGIVVTNEGGSGPFSLSRSS